MPVPWSALLASRPSRRPGARPGARLAAVAFALAIGTAACGTSGSSIPTSPGSSITEPPAGSSVGPGVSPSDGPAPTATTQTRTSWGTIWDAVPASIPTYPGAQAAPTATGPYSAFLVAPSTSVETVTAWYKTTFDRLGFATVVEPPLEDGSRVLDSTGQSSGCKVQTRVGKEGSLTMISMLYGAACPMP